MASPDLIHTEASGFVTNAIENSTTNSSNDEIQLTGPAIIQNTLLRSVGTQTSDTADSSDDNSCHPNIKPSTKIYVKKLLRKYGLLSDPDPDPSSSDSDRNAAEDDSSDTESVVTENNSSKPFEFPVESGAPREEICTSNNWKSFLSFQKQSKDGSCYPCPPEEFEDRGGPMDAKTLTLTKIPRGGAELAINSTYLQKQFKKLVEIEHYHNVVLLSSGFLLRYPFSPLYHHVDDMRSIVAEDIDATQMERNDMNALYYFVHEGWPARLYKDVRSKISQGFITNDEIWALFKPGDIVISKDPVGHFDLSMVTSVGLERESPRVSHMTENAWYVILVKNIWNQRRFKKASCRRRVEIFAGSKKITDLSFYPLSHHDSKDLIRESAIQRGKSWKKYCEDDPTVMSYQGQALSLVSRVSGGRGPPPPPQSYMDGTNQRDYNAIGVMSTVIVDPDATSKAAIQAHIDGGQNLYRPLSEYTVIHEDISLGEFTDEEFMICPASIAVFGLDNHEFFVVGVANLKEKEWKPTAFDRLVLDPEKKETLTRLAKTNSRLVQAIKSKDVIEGKGKGVVLLLHGPPGVGKTLTAEVLSEFTKRPLLKVNLGRVAGHMKWEQALEQIFSNAEDWKAILLIDEAEIVLEKRTFERMMQNSWISVFLRKLEYYKGILILTTNLVDCIDDAFESRISYPVRFHELSRDNRHQIWTDFIKAMNMLPAYKAKLMSEVDRWSEAEINGRQIRNVILMAENLALSDEKHPRLMPQHIDELLNVTIEFCDYNQNNTSRRKKIQLTGGLSY